MNESIESAYFNWLCAKVQQHENPTPSLTYWNLLRAMHGTEFVWLISGDDNRANDGLDLRVEFSREAFIRMDPDWSNLPCSVLEMLIAFSRRAQFETDLGSREWFWIFVDNLGLTECNDARSRQSTINDILNQFIWRTYEFDGQGGLFPLRSPRHDQRKVELWYQFAEYLIEQERL